jgi:uncharacterized integral membrane protein
MGFVVKLVRFWVLLVFAVSTGYFAIYNQDKVALKLPPWIEHISVPAYAAFATFFLFGAIVVTVFFGLDSMRKTFEIRRLNKQVRELGGQVARHADLPETMHSPSVDGPAASLP